MRPHKRTKSLKELLKGLRETGPDAETTACLHIGPKLKLKDGWYEKQRSICKDSLNVHLPDKHGDGKVGLTWDVLIEHVEKGKITESRWVKDYAWDIPFSNFTEQERALLDIYSRIKTNVEAFAFPKIEEITNTKSFYGKFKPYNKWRDKARKPAVPM